MAIDKEKEVRAFFALWESLMNYWEIMLNTPEYGNRGLLIREIGLFWHQLFLWCNDLDEIYLDSRYTPFLQKTDTLLNLTDDVLIEEGWITEKGGNL